MSHELYPSPYPPREPLTDRENRQINKILGIPSPTAKDRAAIKVQELRTQRRIARLQERLRMVPEEVLAASDATKAERDFLLGISDVDPTPQRSIDYTDLEAGEDITFFNNDLRRQRQQKQKIRIPAAMESDSRIDKLLFRLGIYVPASEKRDQDMQASITKQATFHSKVNTAVNTALLTSDAITISELSFLAQVINGLGKPKDPNPEHVITYRRLVAVKPSS